MSDDNRQDVTLLDLLVTDDNLQMMKAALPYVDPQGQRFLSVYAKIVELQKTMSLFQDTGELTAMSAPENNVEPLDMLKDLKQYADPAAQENIDNLINVMSMVQLFQMTQNNNDE